ncbi:MFS general substrate transporter, partial [Mycena maculata]
KLDKHGLLSIPQPSNDKSDLLNFPQWLKIAVLFQVSSMALLSPLNQAVINPAYVPLSVYFHIMTIQASYQTVIAITFAGISSFIWVPLANTYGHRPIMLFTTLIAAASSLGSGKALTWSQLIATCVLNGLGTSSFFTGMVSDCFFLHERGCAMGIFTVCERRGIPFQTFSELVAGRFLRQYVSYRWCYHLPAVLDLAMFVVMLFCLPETLYVHGSKPVVTNKPIMCWMHLWGHCPESKHLLAMDFIHPFKMFKYPSVLFPVWYYSATFALSSILPAVTSATLFCALYNFKVSQTGLALGLGNLIGSTLGELLGGVVIDCSMYLSRKGKQNDEIIIEVRLQGIWVGAILQPIGLLIWGFCAQYKTPYIGPVMGMGVMCFAIQIISTVVYSYTADCYKPQTSKVAQVFNFGMTVGFWSIALGMKIRYQFMAVTMALVGLVSLLLVIFLMFHGKTIREK